MYIPRMQIDFLKALNNTVLYDAVALITNDRYFHEKKIRMGISRMFKMLLLCTCASDTKGAAVPRTPVVTLPHSTHQSCWDIVAEFEQGCYHAEPLTLDPYPLSTDMFERSVPYTTSDQSIHRAFQRARKSGLLKVLAIGGSITFGHQCVSPEGLNDQQCAWPHRLAQWFQDMTQDFKTEVR